MIIKCDCVDICSCYLSDDRVVEQRMESFSDTDPVDDDGLLTDGVCVVTYASGREQRLRRAWMDMAPQVAA